MNENASKEAGEPTEALDVVETIKVTSAHRVFRLNIVRIRELLRAGLTGIDSSKQTLTDILTKIAEAKSNPTNEEHGPKAERTADGMIRLRLDENELKLIEEAAISWNSKVVGELHFHLHNVLCVAAWGAFEGYIQASLAELFTSNPILLSSDRKVSIAEVVAAGSGLIDYLVAKEIDDVGRKNFDDLQAYLRTRFHVQFSNTHAAEMRDMYFLRNVVAHSAGFLRSDQMDMVPKAVSVERGELRISERYLQNAISCLEKAVRQFDQKLHAQYANSAPSSPDPLVKTVEE